MRDRNLLFCAEDLDSQLRARQQRIAGTIDAIPKEQFLVSSDQEVADHVLPDLTIDPLVLQEDQITMDQTETEVDVSGDRMRIFRPDHRGPYYIRGTRVDVDIPFTGAQWIFKYRTNRYWSVFPHAEVMAGSVRVSISLPHDVEREKFRGLFEREMRLIRDYVEASYNQVTAFNQGLPQLLKQSITRRREQLASHANIAELLDIPLAAKADAPAITPVRVEIRRPPPLAEPPKSGLTPEPGIADETFEHILHLIRHQGRTFERTPSTYAVHGEEDLRNIMLGQLNGHFEGEAAGEVFRGSGKTDICIEEDSRAAFVGECKIWTGPTSLAKALDQLLGYLTWRDSKAALIVFNSRNRNFSQLLQAVPGALKSHPLYVADLASTEPGEWRVRMRSKEDEGRRVIVHVFLFDLYQKPNP